MKRNSIQTKGLVLSSLPALGIVFGDIGTSPLYTFKTVLALVGSTDATAVLGSLSLIVWTLIVVTTIKYVNVAMRVDNDGEGGILALMSLLGVKLYTRPVIVAIGLLGASLIYGDGAITPAISVLSALEGMSMLTPFLAPYVLPASVFILITLFAIQAKGAARIGTLFSPIMGAWFLSIGLLGVWGIVHHPYVLKALNPLCGLSYLFTNGLKGFFVLGGVFLCVTGAEALYADMGQFGAKPIRFAWSAIVFPSLVLNYAGQAALVLEGLPLSENIFYQLCPSMLLIPLIVLATAATIIASQSIITGVFSMTRQAIQLGWLPRLYITHTSSAGYGQIYVGVVNWILMIVTLSLTIGFGKSENLASAYGIAVSAAMLATSALLYIALRELWHWSLLLSGAIVGVFISIDAAFFIANLTKLMHGGYVPLLFSFFVYAMMLIWHRGAKAVLDRVNEAVIPIDTCMNDLEQASVARVPGTAIFLTRSTEGTPPVLMWHVRQNHALQEQVLIIKMTTLSIPWVRNANRLTIKEIYPKVWRAVGSYGFMERPNVPRLVRQAMNSDATLVLDKVTYYIGHETILSGDRSRKGLPKLIRKIFAFMQRNAVHESDYFQLPNDSVVKIGRQVEL